MLINRRTYRTRRGEAGKVAAFLKDVYAQYPYERPIRIYTAAIGRLDTVVIELEYENLAQYEQLLPAWVGKQPTALADQWNELTQGDVISEFWQLVE